MFKNLLIGWRKDPPPAPPEGGVTEVATSQTSSYQLRQGQSLPKDGERTTLPVGYQIQEYEIQQVLGVGGFGITYKAHDTTLDELVALKEYMPMGLAERVDGVTVSVLGEEAAPTFQWAMDRFLEEAQTLARIRNYNVVRVRRLFKQNHTAYLVMDFEDGRELKSLLKESPEGLEEDELMGVITPLLHGLDAVHQRGILHRDIKPANVFIRRDGSPLIIDFGAARRMGVCRQPDLSVVSHGYSPLEQYRLDLEQGPWTDIHALGATLYELITRVKPPRAIFREEEMEAGRPDPLVPVEKLVAGRYSPGLLEFIQSALAMKGSDRPANVESWRRILVGGGFQTGRLYEGQKRSCDEVDPDLKRIRVGLGWDVHILDGQGVDLDASAFLLNADGKVRGDGDFIFYNNLVSPCGAVHHQGDSPDGAGEGENEILLVDLDKIPADVAMVVFAVTINDPDGRAGGFGLVQNAFIRLSNDDSGKELFFYNLTRRYVTENAVIVGEIYRHKGQWIFGADSHAFDGGMEGLAKRFGVDLEA